MTPRKGPLEPETLQVEGTFLVGQWVGGVDRRLS